MPFTRSKQIFIDPARLQIPGIEPNPAGEERTLSLLARGGQARADFIHLTARASLYSFATQSFGILNPGAILKPNWHIDLICDHLEGVAQGHIRRLIINLPPRLLKSSLVAQAFPAWWQLHVPTLKVVLVTYGSELTRPLKHGFDTLVESPLYKTLDQNLAYQQLYQPNANSLIGGAGESNRRLAETKNASGGSYTATTIGGTLTGRGGDLLIIDDPIKAHDAHSESERERVNAWVRSTALSRFDNPEDGVLILVMQRLHDQDLSGQLLETGAYHHLCLPAIFPTPRSFVLKPKFHKPERTIFVEQGEALHPSQLSLPHLKSLETEMGQADFAAQYLQDPSQVTRVALSADWFRTYETQKAENTRVPQKFEMLRQSIYGNIGSNEMRQLQDNCLSCPAQPEHRDAQTYLTHYAKRFHNEENPMGKFLILQSWDTATSLKNTADYSVCTTWLVIHPRSLDGTHEFARYYLIHVYRAKLEFPDLFDKLKELARIFMPHLLLIENANAGSAALQSLQGSTLTPLLTHGQKEVQFCQPIAIRPKDSKEVRLHACLPMLQDGAVWLPDEAPWLETFLNEFEDFGGRGHDDQLDSMTQALSYDLSDHWPVYRQPVRKIPLPRQMRRF